MSKQGKVWLVGAGPGDPGLFTRKGREVLAKADVILYDRLVNPGILLAARPGGVMDRCGKNPSWKANGAGGDPSKSDSLRKEGHEGRKMQRG